MTATLLFCKMHGLGNDFMVIDATEQSVAIEKLNIPLLADRHLGVGFDQLLLIERSDDADFACRIFNADGSEAEQCGNGMRCVAQLIHNKSLSAKKTLSIATKAGKIGIQILDNQQIRVDMGQPIFSPERIPFLAERTQALYEIKLAETKEELIIAVVSMGNPHVILRTESIDPFSIADMGKQIGELPMFPRGANVGFMDIVDRGHIRLQTFERGAGLTLACGTNACAAVVAGILNGWLNPLVNVELKHGYLEIEWSGEGHSVFMQGPATWVFSGEI